MLVLAHLLYPIMQLTSTQQQLLTAALQGGLCAITFV